MLCATNNITYPSWCHIIKDACVTGFVLETRHAGPCNAYDTAPPLYVGELTIIKGKTSEKREMREAAAT